MRPKTSVRQPIIAATRPRHLSDLLRSWRRQPRKRSPLLFWTLLILAVTMDTAIRFDRALGFAAMMNYALPGTIVGIAYLVAFTDPPLALPGTASILVLCYVFRYSLAGTRATTAVLAQIDPALEEASSGLAARRDVPVASFASTRRPTVTSDPRR